MSYPKNNAAPPEVAVGSIYLIADGAIQTTGASARVRIGTGAWGASGGTLACDTTSGVWGYIPSQAETNAESFMVAVYKASCTTASITVITSESAVAGRASVGAVLGTALTESAGGGKLAGAMVKFFNVATPTGTINSLPDAVAGAAGGMFIAGSNAATTVASWTCTAACTNDSTVLGNTTMGTLTQTGAASLGVGSTVTFATLAVTGALSAGSTALANTTIGTLTQTGAASWGATTYASITYTGAVLYNSTETHTGNIVQNGTNPLVANATQLAGQAITAAAGVTFPTSVASPTNITAASGVALAADQAVNATKIGGTVQTAGDFLGVWTPTKAGYVDVSIASRSTHSAADVVTALGTGSGLTAVPWNAAWDAEVQSECTDSLTAWGKTGFSLAAAGLDSVVIETGLNARQAMSVIASAVAGILAGAATATVTIKAAQEGTITRIVATVDADGNRSAITLSLPA